jgi:sugar lactone lactonase YvrE
MMRSRMLLTLLVAAAGLAGCAVTQLSTALRQAGGAILPAGFPAGGAPGVSGPAATAPQPEPLTVATERQGAYGTINVTVRWPDRDPRRYAVQALPLAANSIHLKLTRKSDNVQMTEALIARSQGSASATASWRIEAQSGLQLRARAYKEAQPVLASATVIAEGTADVDVVESRIATPSLKLRINIQGDVTTYAGAPPYIEGTGENARFNYASSLVRDPATGNLYGGVSNGVIKVTPDGQVTWVAGGGEMGAQNGTGSAAKFWDVQAITRDATGNLYTVEGNYGFQSARKITPGGVVSTIGDFDQPHGITVDPAGNIYVAAKRGRKIHKIAPNGTVTDLAGSGASGFADGQGNSATFTEPFSIAYESSGSLLVGDNTKVRRVTQGGVVTTLWPNVPGVYLLYGLSIDASDTAYFAGVYGLGKMLAGAAPTGLFYSDIKHGFAEGPPGSGQLAEPRCLIPDGGTGYYIADSLNARIRKMDSSGTLTTLAGSHMTNGPRLSARFNPNSLEMAVDAAGQLFISGNELNDIRKIGTDGNVTLFAGGKYGTADGNASGTGIAGPYGLAVHPSGSIYFSEPWRTARIRKVSPQGTLTTVLENERAGSLAIDASGSVFFAGANFNDIKKLTAEGVLTTHTSGIGGWIAFDQTGKLFAAFNNRVYAIGPDGSATVYAGTGDSAFADGATGSAKFAGINGLAADHAGNLYVSTSDAGTSDRVVRIRKITPDGQVSTLAGGGQWGHQDGFGGGARFYWAGKLAYDKTSGHLYMFDGGYIRRIE